MLDYILSLPGWTTRTWCCSPVCRLSKTWSRNPPTWPTSCLIANLPTCSRRRATWRKTWGRWASRSESRCWDSICRSSKIRRQSTRKIVAHRPKRFESRRKNLDRTFIRWSVWCRICRRFGQPKWSAIRAPVRRSTTKQPTTEFASEIW